MNGPTPTTATANQIVEEMARSLLDYARSKGIVLTIDLVPTEPLRMGGYVERVTVRERRLLAKPFRGPCCVCGESTTYRQHDGFGGEEWRCSGRGCIVF